MEAFGMSIDMILVVAVIVSVIAVIGTLTFVGLIPPRSKDKHEHV